LSLFSCFFHLLHVGPKNACDLGLASVTLLGTVLYVKGTIKGTYCKNLIYLNNICGTSNLWNGMRALVIFGMP